MVLYVFFNIYSRFLVSLCFEGKGLGGLVWFCVFFTLPRLKTVVFLGSFFFALPPKNLPVKIPFYSLFINFTNVPRCDAVWEVALENGRHKVTLRSALQIINMCGSSLEVRCSTEAFAAARDKATRKEQVVGTVRPDNRCTLVCLY